MRNSIIKMNKLFTKKEKQKLLIIFFMMIIAALLETIGIGLIVPFVGIVTNPAIIQEQAILSKIYSFLNFTSVNSFLLFSVGTLLTIFLIKNLYLLLFHYIQYKVILLQQVKLQRQLFKEYLTKPYTFHLQRNTSHLLRNVNEEVSKVFQGIILSGFQLLTEFLVITFIVILLLISSPIATITASAILGGSVFLFFRVFRKKIDYLGKEQQKVNGNTIKWVNQGLGASKEVKVSGKEGFFINAYTEQSLIKVKNSRFMKLLELVPRLYLETLLVSIVLITMIIIIFQGKDTTELTSIMALFAMAAFRILPSINRVVGLITAIRYNQPALDLVYEDLFEKKGNNYSVLKRNSIPDVKDKRAFTNSIRLDNISYRYPNEMDYSIKDVTLSIPIGSSVAFIGESGAGKTTIVDIVLGLLFPERGSILIDGVNLYEQIGLWQKKIGYIPQSIYLVDDTIRRNIAFGVEGEKINDDAIWRALDQAQLKEFVESLPNKLDTTVGERGVRLSGGQRQRIGIARALYHDPEIIFMDEATSALDNETELEIMKAIDGLKGEKTLIIIAHRLSTIKNCDIVYKINKGKLIETNYKLENAFQNKSSII